MTINILLIEDNPLDARLVREYLGLYKKFSSHIFSAETLSEGFNILAGGKIDVVLLDLNLPDSSGLVTFTKLHSVCTAIPVIVLTGLDDEELAKKAIINGAQDYLVKDQLNEILLSRTILYSIERKKSQLKIEESETRFKALWNNTKTGVMLIEEETKIITQVNPMAAELIGLPEEKIVGKTCHQYVCPAQEGCCPISDLHLEVDNAERILINSRGGIVPILKSVQPLILNEKKYLLESFVDITERKIAEQKILESEEKYRRVVEDDLSGDFIISPQGDILMCNQAFVDIFRLGSIENAMKLNAYQFYQNPEDRKKFLEEIKSKKKLINYEERLKLLNGEYIDVLENIIGTFNENGDLLEIKGYILDNTERRKAEQRVLLTKRILSILNRQNDWVSLIKDILNEIKEFTSVDAIAIRLKEGNDFPYFESEGFSEDLTTGKNNTLLCSEPGLSPAEQIANEKKSGCICLKLLRGYDNTDVESFTKEGSCWINELSSLSGLQKQHIKDICHFSGYESIALIPIKSGVETIGLLQMNHREPGKFQLDLIEFFQEICAFIGIAYKRMMSEIRIKEREESFRGLYENAMVGIIRTTVEGKIIMANPQMMHLLGFSSAESGNLGVIDDFYADPLQVSRFRAILKNEGTIHDFNYTIKGRDGKERFVEESGKIISPYKGVPYYEGVVIDVTHRIAAEEFEKKNTERLNCLLKIYEYRPSGTQDLLDYALEQSLYLTSSKVGYIYYYDEEKREFILNSWSKNVMAECTVTEPQTCYGLDNTGIWGEAVRQRKEIILNDFEAAHPLKKGYPEGHVKLTKFLTIPVFEGGQIIAVVGVGNKASDYDETDVKQLKLLMNSVWRIVKKREDEEKINLLSRSVEQSPVSIVITNQLGEVEYVNSKFQENTGYSLKEIMGKNQRFLKSGHIPDSVYAEMWSQISAGFNWSGELLNKGKSGQLFWESITISPILNNGQITHFVGVKENITEKKQMIQELIDAKEKAEELNRLKSSFLANMSHELRTPLIGVIGFSEFLLSEIEDEQHKHMANLIHKGGKRLQNTLNLILNLTQLEAKKLNIKTELVDIKTVLEKVLDDHLDEFDLKALSLKLNIDENVIPFYSDSAILNQIFENLVSNAIKFTSQGGVKVNAFMEGDNLIVEVVDTGIGLSEKDKELVWDEFRQASEGLSRSFEGTGLGLTITQRFLEKLGGSISVESELNKGSTFKVKLPVGPTPQVNLTTINKVVPGIVPPPIKVIDITNPKVLLVEDDPVAVELVRIILSDFYSVEIAGSGPACLDKVKETRYDIILMDINLGKGMNGIDTTNKIRGIENYANVPIIALTAFAMAGDKDVFLKSGCTDYLSKPFKKEQLLQIIKKYVRRRG